MTIQLGHMIKLFATSPLSLMGVTAVPQTSQGSTHSHNPVSTSRRGSLLSFVDIDVITLQTTTNVLNYLKVEKIDFAKVIASSYLTLLLFLTMITVG